MQVTERDFKLLHWINSHGVVTIEHIAVYFNVSEKVAYKRMRKLLTQGLVFHNRYFYNEPGLYYVSPTGVALSLDPLPPLRCLPAGTLRHDLFVTTVSQRLMLSHGGIFITERSLRQKLGLRGVGQRDHVSDGQLHLSDKKIAIEVELSHKSQARLDSIINRHHSNFDIDEVWYFCKSGSIYRKLDKLASQSSMLKAYDIDQFMKQAKDCHVA